MCFGQEILSRLFRVSAFSLLVTFAVFFFFVVRFGVTYFFPWSPRYMCRYVYDYFLVVTPRLFYW